MRETAIVMGIAALAVWFSSGGSLEAIAAASPSPPPVAQAPAATSLTEEERARQYFTDSVLVDQHGHPLRFFSDVLKGRIVLVNLFYASCTDACPLVSRQLAKVQALLGDDFGEQFFFVSLTLDPKRDTPAVLARYAKKFEAREGWIFLTGKKKNVELITARLGHVGTPVEAHSPVLMLGNVPAGRWLKVLPNMPPDAIAARLRYLANPDDLLHQPGAK